MAVPLNREELIGTSLTKCTKRINPILSERFLLMTGKRVFSLLVRFLTRKLSLILCWSLRGSGDQQELSKSKSLSCWVCGKRLPCYQQAPTQQVTTMGNGSIVKSDEHFAPRYISKGGGTETDVNTQGMRTHGVILHKLYLRKHENYLNW